MPAIILGRELLTAPFLGVAVCTAETEIGDCVYISGDEVSGKLQVAPADPSQLLTLPAIGIVASKSTATSCNVILLGAYLTTGLQPGRIYFVGANSKPALTPPTGPAFIQPIGVAFSATKLMVNPSSNLTRVL